MIGAVTTASLDDAGVPRGNGSMTGAGTAFELGLLLGILQQQHRVLVERVAAAMVATGPTATADFRRGFAHGLKTKGERNARSRVERTGPDA
jgi:hypothetical protein